MRRRAFLKSSAGAVLAGLPVTSTAENSIRGYTSSPDPHAERITLPDVTLGQTRVSDQRWVHHALGYSAVGDDDEHELAEMVRVPEYEFVIDGHQVVEPRRYWSPIKSTDTEPSVQWEFVLPPQPPGEHTFEARIEFPRPIRNSRNDGRSRVWKGEYELATSYEVVAANERDTTQLASVLENFGHDD